MAGYPTDIINAPDGEGSVYDDANTPVLEWRPRADGTTGVPRFRIFPDGRSHGQPSVDLVNWLYYT